MQPLHLHASTTVRSSARLPEWATAQRSKNDGWLLRKDAVAIVKRLEEEEVIEPPSGDKSSDEDEDHDEGTPQKRGGGKRPLSTPSPHSRRVRFERRGGQETDEYEADEEDEEWRGQEEEDQGADPEATETEEET